MSSGNIILASEDLLSDIETIARETWPDTYGEILSATQLEYMLERFYERSVLKDRMAAGSLFHLYQEAGISMGFSEIRFNEQDRFTKLHKLYVLPELQGRSVGKLLLNNAIAVSKAVAQDGILLNVNRYNKAKLFYERQGFMVQYDEDIDIGQGFYMNDHVMQLNFE